LVDVRKELTHRNIPYNKLLPKSVLAKKLEAILDKEDAQEQYTIDEAKWNIEWERIRREREALVHTAKRFANCPHFEKLLGLWTTRLRGADDWSPVVAPQVAHKSAGWESAAKKHEQLVRAQQAAVAAKTLDVIETQQLSFQNRLVAVNTAWLWGRRIKHVSCGTSVAYALTDSGEVYCWGGAGAIVEYFNLGQTMPSDVRAGLALDKLQEIIEFDLSADLAANAMRLRGLAVHAAGKQAIVDDLSKALLLEIECMGGPFHDRMKRLDAKYRQALHTNNAKLVTELLKRGATTWRGLRKLYHALDEEVAAGVQAKQDNWDAKRDEIRRLRLKQDRIGRENAESSATKSAAQTIDVSGLTSRGPSQKQFQGGHALNEISVGAKHALAIHASG
ncbi:hypothetical protein DYB26_016014, partial [Aphanomyces astaci]